MRPVVTRCCRIVTTEPLPFRTVCLGMYRPITPSVYRGVAIMENSRLFALYGNPDSALAALDDLAKAGTGAESVSVLSPHAAGRHGSATAADIPAGRPADGNVNVAGIGPLVVVGPLASPLRDRDITAVLHEGGVGLRDAQSAAEGLRRGATLLVVDAPRSSHDEILRIVDRHHPIGPESLGPTYLEPGWSRVDRVAGDDGVLEVADDLLNVKRPGEDSAAFRPLAPGEDELGLAKSGAENPEAGKGEIPGGQGAGPDR
jgi:hypothetical protein